jgi:hypothetical protein
MIAALAGSVAAASAAAVAPIAQTPNVHGEPNAPCAAHGVLQVRLPATPEAVLLYRHDRPARLSRLTDLPRPDHEKAVLRSIGDCAAPRVVDVGVGR